MAEDKVEDKDKEKDLNKDKSLPVLPVRDTVLFPHAVLPLTVGRESSVQLINSIGEGKTISAPYAARAYPQSCKDAQPELVRFC